MKKYYVSLEGKDLEKKDFIYTLSRTGDKILSGRRQTETRGPFVPVPSVECEKQKWNEYRG